MQNISSADFFQETHFNPTTKDQLWMSLIADSHDSICNCWHPFAHLLANIFPPGHKDRNLTINQIIERDYKEKCHSGGAGAADFGGAAAITEEGPGTSLDKKEGEDYIKDEELEDLIAAGESAATR